MSKVTTQNVMLDIDISQGGTNTIGVGSLEVDPFQTKQGYRVKAVEVKLDPADLKTIAADAHFIVQLWAGSAAPSAAYDVGDDNVIFQFGLAFALTTSGMALVPCQALWSPPYSGAMDLGALYIGGLLDSAGMAGSVAGSIRIYGDVLTLTTDEQNASRALYT